MCEHTRQSDRRSFLTGIAAGAAATAVDGTGIRTAKAAGAPYADPGNPALPKGSMKLDPSRATTTISFPQIVLGTAGIALLTILGTWAFGAFEGLGAGGALALIVGIAASYAVGVGLMTAVFYSSRRHDQAAHDAARGEFKLRR